MLQYRYDRVFDMACDNCKLFEESDVPFLVSKGLKGDGVAICACGHEGSGKTHTIRGSQYARAEVFEQSHRYPRQSTSNELLQNEPQADKDVGVTVRCIRELYKQLYSMNAY